MSVEDLHYEKSKKLIKEAMKDVIAEFVIKLSDDESHLVYITKFEIKPNGEVVYDFSTFDQSKKSELIPHIEAIFSQMYQSMPITKYKKVKGYFLK